MFLVIDPPPNDYIPQYSHQQLKQLHEYDQIQMFAAVHSCPKRKEQKMYNL